MKHTLLVLCLLIGVGFVGTGSSQDPASVTDPLDQLARAEAKWQTSRTDAYQFRFEYACNGLIPPTPQGVQPGLLFRVKDGTSTFLRSDVAESVGPDLVQYSTVQRLFAFIRMAWTRQPSRLTVQYDPKRGYPTRLCVDPSAVADDEFGFLVTDFKVLSNIAGESKR